MVVFLDQFDGLIICTPPGDIVVKKMGLAGLEFNCNYTQENTKVNQYAFDPSRNLTTPNNQQTFSITDPKTNQTTTTTTKPEQLIYAGYTESDQAYNFAVSSFLNILDESGNPYGLTFKDTLDALCVFLNFKPSSGGGGEVNTASNVGGGSGVFKQKTGVDLELRSMVAGSNITITSTADEITFDASGGSGEVNTASNLGAGEGVFAQKTAQDLEFKSLVAGSGISLASTATELTVTSTSAGIPLVDDDVARDAAYPTPTNNLQVFNKRQGLIETYNSFYDLWISAGMNVCVEDSTVQVVAPQKAVYIVPTAASIGGVEFPVLGYTSASAERNVTQGVVTRRGAATANPNQTYIAVHHFGVYYVDYGAAVTIGFNVYPRTVGVGDVIGAAFAQSGTIGQAIENSGSNPSFPNSVLVSLQQRR